MRAMFVKQGISVSDDVGRGELNAAYSGLGVITGGSSNGLPSHLSPRGCLTPTVAVDRRAQPAPLGAALCVLQLAASGAPLAVAARPRGRVHIGGLAERAGLVVCQVTGSEGPLH